MAKQRVLSDVLRFLRKVVLIDLAIFAAVAISCWLTGGFADDEYGVRLFWAGIAAIIIGVSSPIGNWGITRSFYYQYGASASGRNIHQRLAQEVRDSAQSYGFLIRMTAVGVVPIAVGALIQTVAR